MGVFCAYPAPVARTLTEVEVADGLGVVEVLGNDFASVLYLRGEPAWLHAADCQGSVGQLAGWAGSRPGELDALRDWLAEPGLRVDRRSGDVRGPLLPALQPFLRLLTWGRYRVSAYTLPWRELWVADFAGRDVFPWYWPVQGDALVATGGWPPPDAATVHAYRQRIAKGTRPAAVVVSPPGGSVGYLLDGHHKLAAYGAQRVPALLIEITPARPVPLPRKVFAAILQESHREQFARALEDWRWFGPPPDGAVDEVPEGQ
jgi:hypothetical protein